MRPRFGDSESVRLEYFHRLVPCSTKVVGEFYCHVIQDWVADPDVSERVARSSANVCHLNYTEREIWKVSVLSLLVVVAGAFAGDDDADAAQRAPACHCEDPGTRRIGGPPVHPRNSR